MLIIGIDVSHPGREERFDAIVCYSIFFALFLEKKYDWWIVNSFNILYRRSTSRRRAATRNRRTSREDNTRSCPLHDPSERLCSGYGRVSIDPYPISSLQELSYYDCPRSVVSVVGSTDIKGARYGSLQLDYCRYGSIRLPLQVRCLISRAASRSGGDGQYGRYVQGANKGVLRCLSSL